MQPSRMCVWHAVEARASCWLSPISSVAVLCSFSVRGMTSALVFMYTCRSTSAESVLDAQYQDFPSGHGQIPAQHAGWWLHAEGFKPYQHQSYAGPAAGVAESALWVHLAVQGLQSQLCIS